MVKKSIFMREIEHKRKKESRNPLDDMLDELDKYQEECEPRDLLDSGE
jgi:hypothetical protein